MHSFLGFLGTVILFIEMINYAHADMDREDDEELQAGAMIVSKAESSSLGLANRDNTQGDGKIKSVGDRADNAGAIDSSRVEHIRALADSGYAASGLRAMPDSLSEETKRGGDEGAGKRVAKKLKAGALGSLVGFLGGVTLGVSALGIGGGGDGIGGGEAFYLVGSFGAAVGAAVSVSQVDTHDLLAASLMGSMLGFGASFGLVYISGSPNAFLVSPVLSVASAVWLSEDSRNRSAELTLKPPETCRFSVGLGIDTQRHLLAVAKLQF